MSAKYGFFGFQRGFLGIRKPEKKFSITVKILGDPGYKFFIFGV